MTEAELRTQIEAIIQDALDQSLAFELIYGVLCGLSQRVQLVWSAELAISMKQKGLVHE